MQKNKLIAIISLLFLSCNSSNVTVHKRIEIRQMKESFIYDFKTKYFEGMLLHAFNKSPAIKEILGQDHSGYGDPIMSQENMHLIDSLTKLDNQKMVSDSAWSIEHMHEGVGGKRVLDYVLAKYQSKWLDSIAKARCRLFIKDWKSADR